MSFQSKALDLSWRIHGRTLVLKFSGNMAALTATKVDTPKINLIVDNRIS